MDNRAPRTANLWRSFCACEAAHPERRALLHTDGATTYAQLKQRALSYCARYQALGLRPHDRVLLWMCASPDMAAAMLGAWAAGCITVPLETTVPAHHLEHTVDTVRPQLIVTDQDAPLSAAVDIPTVSSEVVQDHPANATPTPTLATDPASIVFTSGSTGRPKGATHPHRNLVNAARTIAEYLGYTQNDRILCAIPWSSIYGCGHMLAAAICGVTVAVPPKLNAFGLCDAIDRHQPTILPVIPQIMSILLHGISPFRSLDTSNIRLVTNAGGTMPTTLLAQARAALPNADITLNYGSTEACRTSYLSPSLLLAKPTSIGKPIPGVDILLVREDGSIIDRPGEAGHLVHRGEFLFSGYWGNPEATARALRPDPLAPPGAPNATPVLFTGDLATMDNDGYFFHAGRIDQQLKPMGVRVSPAEVEELIYSSNLVREAAVFGMPHDLFGDEVWAAVVPNDPSREPKLTAKLATYARATMSPSMMPRQYLVFTDPLPKTRTGKVDYPRLKELAELERNPLQAVA